MLRQQGVIVFFIWNSVAITSSFILHPDHSCNPMLGGWLATFLFDVWSSEAYLSVIAKL